MNTVDILAFGAHPDDVELSCAGTIIKQIKLGKSVAIVDLTQGELGTRGNAETRKMEAQKASEIMGVSVRENLLLDDGFIENTKEQQMKVVQMIRKYQPSLVLANAIDDRHPDHPKAAKLVADACFLAGLPKVISQDEKGKNQEAWRPKQIFHYIQWKDITPDFVVDITGFEKTKMDACMAYQSQFYNPNSQEKETPISTKNFSESIMYRMKNLGRLSGVEYAEGFTSGSPICLENLNEFL